MYSVSSPFLGHLIICDDWNHAQWNTNNDDLWVVEFGVTFTFFCSILIEFVNEYSSSPLSVVCFLQFQLPQSTKIQKCYIFELNNS